MVDFPYINAAQNAGIGIRGSGRAGSRLVGINLRQPAFIEEQGQNMSVLSE